MIVFIKNHCILIVTALSSLTLDLATQNGMIRPIQHTTYYIFTLATKFMMRRNKTGTPAGIDFCFSRLGSSLPDVHFQMFFLLFRLIRMSSFQRWEKVEAARLTWGA
jgi:hypothetical protein